MATEHFIKSGNEASANWRNIVYKSKSETIKTLFSATVQYVALYNAEVWALRYMNEIEVVQTKFFKCLYRWPRNTSNYFVLLETGLLPLKYYIIKRTVLW